MVKSRGGEPTVPTSGHEGQRLGVGLRGHAWQEQREACHGGRGRQHSRGFPRGFWKGCDVRRPGVRTGACGAWAGDSRHSPQTPVSRTEPPGSGSCWACEAVCVWTAAFGDLWLHQAARAHVRTEVRVSCQARLLLVPEVLVSSSTRASVSLTLHHGGCHRTSCVCQHEPRRGVSSPKLWEGAS